MDLAPPTHNPSPLSRLQRLARPKPAQERCELCGAVIGENHPHLLELNTRQLVCACDACGILFSDDQNQRYRRVTRRVKIVSDLPADDPLWEELHIPINLAFFYHSAAANKTVAMYPSPAGATESLLPMNAWDELTARSPAVRQMKSDVEALLIDHVRGRNDCFIVSIDECYRLVGLIRRKWRGISGGSEVWREIETFFDDLHRRASRTGGGGHA